MSEMPISPFSNPKAANAQEGKEISIKLATTAPDEKHNKLSNEGKVIPTTGLMSLKSILVANQDPTPEENMDLKAAPKNIAQEQKDCATLLKDASNKHPSCASAILLSQNPGVLPT
ncbi:hypothetical protein DSO57_1032686 [Entomophthora muscae]|uniref:Uncharacterized protein n=1 Tax=Entomophthora muscae TaxID=34485 RepID=A0ACC2T0S5_9FUNG|nr:hypothetical protein DSO57_1032686 [Entomophthora muscae]